jgi:hypothetical protein
MGAGQLIYYTVVKSLFFTGRMTGKTIGTVVGITLHPVVLLIHAPLVVLMTIGTGELSIVG